MPDNECFECGAELAPEAIKCPECSGRRFRIWAVVAGGLTGHREAWAKENGKILEFSTRDEAEARARKMRKIMAAGASPARFTYTVEEV